jgi:hypothetical protein
VNDERPTSILVSWPVAPEPGEGGLSSVKKSAPLANPKQKPAKVTKEYFGERRAETELTRAPLLVTWSRRAEDRTEERFEVVFSMILLVCLGRFGSSWLTWKSMGSSIAEAKDRIETSSIRAA